jgi:hypothetical protein
MKKVIKLTESDLTNIVKRVIKEQSSSFSGAYFVRRGIDFDKIMTEVITKMKICGSVKLKTYFNKVLERVIVNLYLHHLKTEFENDESLEQKIREYMIENKLDTMMRYYKIICGKEPKY